jgi:protein-tyrosine phosphatase
MLLTDTHSHILPEMDDGAINLSQSLDFARQAKKEGVGTIFATPHCCDGVYNCEKEVILKSCLHLSEALREESIDVRVLPGAEIKVGHDLIARFDAGQLLTLANTGTYILLELPPMFIEKAIFLMIKQLRDRGITSIIAHAERNPMILNRSNLAADIINQGAVIQITAGSLCGDFGRVALKAARAFVEAEQVFCLGSDIHPGRKYRMADAERRLNKLIGSNETAKLFQENPEMILSGYELRKTGDG